MKKKKEITVGLGYNGLVLEKNKNSVNIPVYGIVEFFRENPMYIEELLDSVIRKDLHNVFDKYNLG